ELYAGEQRLTDYDVRVLRVSLPSDRSFAGYETALALVNGPPLPVTTEIIWNQALLDVLLVYETSAPVTDLSIRPNFERLGMRTVTTLRFIAAEGIDRAYEFTGDPGLVRLDPRWHHAFLRFVVLGFEHILDGADHLLFILCLIIPLRRIRPLVIIVTAFTVAHSVTLLASAFGFVPTALWFVPLVETLIAASIVYLALENIIAGNLRRRWIVAFGFGLVHGFGFSFALSETMQFAGSHLLTSLIAFNIGIELGQVLVVLVAVPAMAVLFRYVMPERVGIIILSALIAHSGWHWMSERFAVLQQYSLW
ncbi:MAG: HupE/UreJ family protein, partial [Woeseiaceae bacterium]